MIHKKLFWISGEAYPGGQEFCRGQKFHVAESNVACFQFDRTVFSRASRLCSMIQGLYKYLFILIRRVSVAPHSDPCSN